MGSPFFSEHELACPHCGEGYEDAHALGLLDRLRMAMGPLKLNSAHRCDLHNARVGGAPLSMHKKLAFDVALQKYDRGEMCAKAKAVGFTGFGFAQTYLHLDTRLRPAHWFYGPISERLWQGKII